MLIKTSQLKTIMGKVTYVKTVMMMKMMLYHRVSSSPQVRLSWISHIVRKMYF